MPRVRSFDELTPNRQWAEEIRRVYSNDIDKVDLQVGMYAEPLPPGFGFSDTAFRVFVLMASRRLKSDRFFTTDFRPEVYRGRDQVGHPHQDEGRAAAPLSRAGAFAGGDAGNAFLPWHKIGPTATATARSTIGSRASRRHWPRSTHERHQRGGAAGRSGAVLGRLTASGSVAGREPLGAGHGDRAAARARVVLTAAARDEAAGGARRRPAGGVGARGPAPPPRGGPAAARRADGGGLGGRAIREVLGRSADVYASDAGAKAKGMSHFQPQALTLSRGEEWRDRRNFAESVLAARERLHPSALRFVDVVADEIGRLPGELALDWSAWEGLFDHVTLRVIFGDAAREELAADGAAGEAHG